MLLVLVQAICLLSLSNNVAAFQVAPSAFGVTVASTRPLSRTVALHAAEDDKTDFPSTFETEDQDNMNTGAEVRNLGFGQDGRVQQPKWTDTEMSANSNIFNMSWWGYILVLYPVTLLADDAFHFLPKDTGFDIKNLFNSFM
jgi:hypothetical protein